MVEGCQRPKGKMTNGGKVFSQDLIRQKTMVPGGVWGKGNWGPGQEKTERAREAMWPDGVDGLIIGQLKHYPNT